MFQSDATSNLISWFSVFNFQRKLNKQVMEYSRIIVQHNFPKLSYQ